MAKIFTEIDDKASDSVPSIADMRDSQRQGGQGKGTNDAGSEDLNRVQGHGVDIRE